MVAQLADTAPVEPAADRPAPPSDSLGRRLRALIGVNEDVLDWTPEIRPLYTKIGVLVLTTSALAAVSMLTALVKFLDAHWLLLIPAAVFWGWVIFCIDSLLITTMHGAQNAGRVFWMRLVLAGLLGLIIAEPLLLKVFEPAIHRQVAETRVLERAARESALKACNPVPYKEITVEQRDNCDARKLLLTVPSDPAGVTVDIAEKQRERDLKQRELDADKKTLQKLRDTAGLECNGQKGRGLSGKFGNGPRCKEANRNAESFPEQNRLDARQQEINGLDDTINQLIDKRNAVARDYAGEMDKAIKTQLPTLDGEIGLLEEDKALSSLSGESLLVRVGSWLLRLLLVVIDCLPVISKRLSGPTPYDRMFTRRIGSGEERFELDNELRVRLDRESKVAALIELDQLDRARQWDRNAAEERTRIQQDEKLNWRIDEYARKLRGEDA
jgi:hypothetical protein